MRLTVEHLLYTLILLVAAAMRFFALGLLPLTPGEAQNAWAAWLAATGQTIAHPIAGTAHSIRPCKPWSSCQPLAAMQWPVFCQRCSVWHWCVALVVA